MMFTLPNTETLYAALVARSPQYDGRAYVGVTSTGIFCRLTCPAKKPKLENCRFYETVGECIEAGFRPCKRCYPLAPMVKADPVIAKLLDALNADPTRRWSEADVVGLGLDASTVRRSFKRHFGMTFLEMARQRGLREGFETMSGGGKVIEAQIDAGFESASAFRAVFAKLLGQAPGDFVDNASLRANWIETPLGSMVCVSDKNALHLLEFIDRKALPYELRKLRDSVRDNLGIGCFAPSEQIEQELTAFFAGECADFKTPLMLHGTPFSREVWQNLRQIPAGETRSYKQLAEAIGRPSATRAVARANVANQLALVVPCHRVIGADGDLTGYGGGLWRKQRLIELEQHYKIIGG